VEAMATGGSVPRMLVTYASGWRQCGWELTDLVHGRGHL
jgi:hypothetical protein